LGLFTVKEAGAGLPDQRTNPSYPKKSEKASALFVLTASRLLAKWGIDSPVAAQYSAGVKNFVCAIPSRHVWRSVLQVLSAKYT
jgi:hypothetical protein